MANMEISYPQYRKYKNGRSFFRISSNSTFDEIQVLGSRYFLHPFTAKILPDRNLIYDMTFDFELNWEQITEADFAEALSKVK
jgi:hypothetical protein